MVVEYLKADCIFSGDDLIENLSSDDEAVRFAAIGALRRITGQTNGYRFDAPSSERSEGIARWKAWLATKTATP